MLVWQSMTERKNQLFELDSPQGRTGTYESSNFLLSSLIADALVILLFFREEHGEGRVALHWNTRPSVGLRSLHKPSPSGHQRISAIILIYLDCTSLAHSQSCNICVQSVIAILTMSLWQGCMPNPNPVTQTQALLSIAPSREPCQMSQVAHVEAHATRSGLRGIRSSHRTWPWAKLGSAYDVIIATTHWARPVKAIGYMPT